MKRSNHKHILSIKNLVVGVEDKQVLRGISLMVRSGEVHALMGPNGSGKSTLAYTLMGHPTYKIQIPKSKLQKKSTVKVDTKNILGLEPEERAAAGLFLAFQSPIAVPGVSVVNLLRTAYRQLHGVVSATKALPHNPVLARQSAESALLATLSAKIREYAVKLRIPAPLLSRGIHDGFSGGEKKKIEMLQALVLSPKFAIFDEIDTGLDVDALKTVALGIKLLASAGTGVIVVTHYQRILRYVKPDYVHILVAGKIVKTGSATLARDIENNGYSNYL